MFLDPKLSPKGVIRPKTDRAGFCEWHYEIHSAWLKTVGSWVDAFAIGKAWWLRLKR